MTPADARLAVRGQRTERARRGWTTGPDRSRTDRPFADGRAPDPQTARRRILSSIGLIAVILSGNLLVGLAWEQVAGTDERPFSARLGAVGAGGLRDPRVDHPAMGGAPWARTHFDELQQVPGGYWPFLLTAQGSFRGETITTSGWERASYEAPGGGARPTVMFFGGSTTFGDGQRDEHTIASEVARLAEAAGMPIRAVNVGQRAWVLWQETLLFEQLSALEAPDIAVFYDGGNEVAAQLQASTAGHPTHYDVDSVATRLTGRPPRGAEPAAPGPSEWDQAVAAYRAHSAVHKALRQFRSRQPAAEGVADSPRVDDLAAVGRDAAEVYRRGRAVAIDIAERRGVEPVFFWQPTRYHAEDESHLVAAAQIGPPTIDIRDALDDHHDVYLDAIHTNEEGARIVAARMWEHLEPLIAAAHGRR